MNTKRMLQISAILAIVMGILAIGAGFWGISYTKAQVAQENITTPKDAAIPDAPVLGPWTLKAQADVIRTHTLEITGGKTYAEMPRMVPQVDEEGNAVVDENGEPVMVPNKARDIWVTATALSAALNLAILAYTLIAFAFLFGLVSIWTGMTYYVLSKKM